MDIDDSTNSIEVSLPDRRCILVELSGEFDIDDLETLRRILDAAARLGRSACADLAGVTFLDLLCARELADRASSREDLVIGATSRQARASLRACCSEARQVFQVLDEGTVEELCPVREIPDGTRR